MLAQISARAIVLLSILRAGQMTIGEIVLCCSDRGVYVSGPECSSALRRLAERGLVTLRYEALTSKSSRPRRIWGISTQGRVALQVCVQAIFDAQR